MIIQETAQVLALIQTFEPRREVGDSTILTWHEIIGSLPFPEAVDAVRDYYSTQTWPVMPAHIIERVDRARAQRARDERIALSMTMNAIAAGDQALYNHLSDDRFKDMLLDLHRGLTDPETRAEAWAEVERVRGEAARAVAQQNEATRLAIAEYKAARP